ncbi:MAG TPA: hypothetical protein VFR24_25975 [Candidatus Angelobacter sp.]|nr:hypothetical protein [Candidatus Angelobacter sp.]
MAHLTAANFNNNPATVNDPCVKFTVPNGINFLVITVVSPDNQDTITVSEDCGDGTKTPIDHYAYKPSDPARGFVIVGQ